MRHSGLRYLSGAVLVFVLLLDGGAAGAASSSASGGSASRTAEIGKIIQGMTLKEKVGQMFVPYVYGE